MTERELHADCTRCFGLCCVLAPFRRSADFPVSKPSGVACLHLADDDRCRIHDRLREEGWAGCASFDCLGAGQHVSQVVYGATWRGRGPGELGEMAAVLSTVRQLHELLHVLDVLDRRLGSDAGTTGLAAEVERLTLGTPAEILAVDVDALRERCRPVLDAGSRRIRRPAGPGLAHADLAGADLSGRDLARADLRGALLIGADLRGADLTDADVLGADLRGARTAGARLEALFLTPGQRASTRPEG